MSLGQMRLRDNEVKRKIQKHRVSFEREGERERGVRMGKSGRREGEEGWYEGEGGRPCSFVWCFESKIHHSHRLLGKDGKKRGRTERGRKEYGGHSDG